MHNIDFFDDGSCLFSLVHSIYFVLVQYSSLKMKYGLKSLVHVCYFRSKYDIKPTIFVKGGVLLKTGENLHRRLSTTLNSMHLCWWKSLAHSDNREKCAFPFFMFWLQRCVWFQLYTQNRQCKLCIYSALTIEETVKSLSCIFSVSQSTFLRVLRNITACVIVKVSYKSHNVSNFHS